MSFEFLCNNILRCWLIAWSRLSLVIDIVRVSIFQSLKQFMILFFDEKFSLFFLMRLKGFLWPLFISGFYVVFGRLRWSHYSNIFFYNRSPPDILALFVFLFDTLKCVLLLTCELVLNILATLSVSRPFW